VLYLSTNFALTSAVLFYFASVFAEVLAIFATSRIAFPTLLRDLFTILSAFNLNLEITAPECMVPSLSFGLKWAALMLLPIAALAILAVVHLCLTLNKLLLMGRKCQESCCSHVDKLISVFTTGCFVLYLMLTQSVFSIFNCNPTGELIVHRTYQHVYSSHPRFPSSC